MENLTGKLYLDLLENLINRLMTESLENQIDKGRNLLVAEVNLFFQQRSSSTVRLSCKKLAS